MSDTVGTKILIADVIIEIDEESKIMILAYFRGGTVVMIFVEIVWANSPIFIALGKFYIWLSSPNPRTKVDHSKT